MFSSFLVVLAPELPRISVIRVLLESRAASPTARGLAPVNPLSDALAPRSRSLSERFPELSKLRQVQIGHGPKNHAALGPVQDVVALLNRHASGGESVCAPEADRAR